MNPAPSSHSTAPPQPVHRAAPVPTPPVPDRSARLRRLAARWATAATAAHRSAVPF